MPPGTSAPQVRALKVKKSSSRHHTKIEQRFEKQQFKIVTPEAVCFRAHFRVAWAARAQISRQEKARENGRWMR
jgi:hypothetical protein